MDQADMDNHFKKASKAFGALRHGIFSSKLVSCVTKKDIYTGLYVAILFHSAESMEPHTEISHQAQMFPCTMG
eukprot:10638833-Ditylum_brightwellii.AAC.1